MVSIFIFIKNILNGLLNILLTPFSFSKKDIDRDKIKINGQKNKTNINIININIHNHYSKQEEIRSKYIKYINKINKKGKNLWTTNK